eukprot:TRINITY_DN41382_c0_g1_i1.p1 TRINITY_DN41382_c0_g1~~TRINITY_DN41382_c0_g1_i1.p1  ORF type:complete len:119 (+),score=11.58 TRINITY_DN41382_c0_g1_i1:176-532(+)
MAKGRSDHKLILVMCDVSRVIMKILFVTQSLSFPIPSSTVPIVEKTEIAADLGLLRLNSFTCVMFLHDAFSPYLRSGRYFSCFFAMAAFLLVMCSSYALSLALSFLLSLALSLSLIHI